MRKGRFAGFNVSRPEAADGRRSGRSASNILLLLIGPILVALVAIFVPSPVAIALATGAALILSGLGLKGVAETDPPQEVPTDQARAARLVDGFEESGGGWFWETNADGLVTYVSAQLARALERDRESVIGARFDELPLVEERGSDQRPAIGFHLSSRFPFANVIVTPNGRSDLCWSLSGRPRFDEVGRFLGFHGVGLNLDESQRAEIRSTQLAGCDSLTGLPNRARMRAMLDEALANSTSRQEGSSLFLIDLDRFKQVNDSFGHPVGDLLLKEVAKRLSATLGSEGQVGRLGGDEFEAVLPGVDEEGRLGALAERLIAKVSAPYIIRGHSISIGASIGIAISRPGKTLADALIKEADLALYAAKRAGRGTHLFFESHMHAVETERQILESDLRGAVAKGQLKLLFQPVIDVATEELRSFEALVRWAHPVRGLLAPADFLPLAVAGGLMPSLGEWILRTACGEAARWPKHLRLAVNLSLAELESPQLPGLVAHALAASGLDPELMELDLAEPTLLSERPELLSALASIKALGVRLALDDFGAGAASLLSLRSVQLDRIKIHPSLLRSAIPGDGPARTILAAVASLADSLGMDITAEGVESAEALALVREIGCDSVQGYLFGRPMSANETFELAAASGAAAEEQAYRPRSPRQSLIRQGSIGWTGGNLPVRLRNISADGAMIESSQPIESGIRVEIDLSGGIRLAGQVRWSEGGRVGVKFEEAFDLQRLGKGRRTAVPGILKPDYLGSELAPDSPWAARQERLSVKDVKR